MQQSHCVQELLSESYIVLVVVCASTVTMRYKPFKDLFVVFKEEKECKRDPHDARGHWKSHKSTTCGIALTFLLGVGSTMSSSLLAGLLEECSAIAASAAIRLAREGWYLISVQ